MLLALLVARMMKWSTSSSEFSFTHVFSTLLYLGISPSSALFLALAFYEFSLFTALPLAIILQEPCSVDTFLCQLC